MKESGVKSKKCFSEFAVFRRLAFLAGIYFRRLKLLLAVSLVLGGGAETLAMIMPRLTGELAASLGDWSRFRTAALFFLGIGAAQFILAVTNDVFDRLLKDRLGRDSFCFTHEAVLSLDHGAFHDNSGGENMLNINASVSAAHMILELVCFPVFYVGGLCVGLVMLVQAFRGIRLPLWTTLLLTCGMAAQPLLTWYFGKLISRAYTRVRDAGKVINEELLNDLRAPGELRIMAALKSRFSAMFLCQHRMALAMDRAMLLHIASRYSMTLMILLFQSAIVISVLFGTRSSAAEVRDLIAAILLMPLMFNHLNKLQQMYNNVKDQEPYIGKLVELFRRHSEIPRGDRDFLCGPPPDLELRDVTFGYESDIPVLRGFSMRLPGGRCGALVAPAGGGKSTVLKLISRLYLPKKGSILIAEEDIFTLREESYRAKCIVISQFPLFIKGTIRDNFHLQVPDASDDEIAAACGRMGLTDMLGIAPENIPDHQLSLGADNLSGGQRKMLALARAIMMEPRILLLDEPSVGLDGPTIRNRLLPALSDLKGKMTILVIDHNMNFLSDVADDVYVIDDGRIAEYGPASGLHNDRNSRFYAFCAEWNAQKREF